MKKYEITFHEFKNNCRYRYKDEDDKKFWCWNVKLAEKRCRPSKCPIIKKLKEVKP